MDKQIMINSSSASQIHPIQWTSVSSQMMLGSVNKTPLRSGVRDMNWNSPPVYSPGKIQGSPFPIMGINPMGSINQNLNLVMNQNQRYQNMAVSEGRPSEVESMNLISQVLNQKPILPNNLNISPIKSVATPNNQEFMPMKAQIIMQLELSKIEENFVRETVEIPIQPAASTNTFKAVNFDDIPAQSSKQANMNKISESPEQEFYQDIRNSTQASIDVPKYNFEEMLQKALEEQGENPSAPPEDNDPSPPKSKKRKPKFLKRKKRYDPREAIKKEKESKTKSKISDGESKFPSAFPKGFLNSSKSKLDSEKDDNESDNSHESDHEIQVKRKPKKAIDKSPKLEDDAKDSDREENNDEVENDDDTKSNKNNIKPFLKRKSRVVKFHKVDWKNVKGRIDCWSKPSARSCNRDKSNPPPSKNKAVKSKQDEKPKTKNKKLNNIQSRIDTGIRRNNKPNQFGSDLSDKSFDAANQYNLGEYANEGHVEADIQFVENQANFQPKVETKRFNFKKTVEEQDQPIHNPYLNNFYEEEYLQNDEVDHNYDVVEHQYQEYTPPMQKNNYDPSPYNEENEEVEIEMERDKIPTLNIDQLEHLYSDIHPNPIDLESCSKLNPHSILPQIHIDYYSQILNSPQMISEEIYDIILEELRNQYERLCSY